MRALVRVLVLVVASFAVSMSPALAGTYVLHPSGFGEHSYSSWKGGEGLPDSVGNKNQALYFQKMTSTATFAAGVAVFKGVEGLPTAALGELQFWWGIDGHCGAGAPRFNLRLQETGGTFFIGCAGMLPGATAMAPNGRMYEQRSFPAGALPAGTVASLAIVFDEGNDVGQGFVFLDNIRAAGHTWTSASDNGNGEAWDSSPYPLTDLLAAPLESLFN